MRQLFLSFFLVCLTFISSVDAIADVIKGPFVLGSGSWITIANGGFESGLADWSDMNGNTFWGTFTTDHSGPVAYGSKSAQSNPKVSAQTGPGFTIWQGPLTLSTLKTYVLSGFFNTQDLIFTNLDYKPHIYVQLISSNIKYTAAVTGGAELEIGESKWQFAWTEFKPEQNELYLRIIHDNYFASGEHGYFDEIAITELDSFKAPTTVPLPSAVWLLGSALIGFVGLRRKFNNN